MRLMLRSRSIALLAVFAILVALLSVMSTWPVFAQDSSKKEVPARPTGLTSTAAHNAVALTWDDPNDNSITHYQVLRREPAVHEPGYFVTINANTGSAATTYTDSTVEPETRYVFRVKAVNAVGVSKQSRFTNINTPPEPTPTPTPEPISEPDPVAPARPTGLTNTATHNAVTLTWDGPNDNSITHYQVLRREPAVHDPGYFVTIAENTGSTDTSYTDGTAAAETSYVYRVIAVNNVGASPRSSYTSARTSAAPDPVRTPEPTPAPVPPPVAVLVTPEPEEPLESEKSHINTTDDAGVNHEGSGGTLSPGRESSGTLADGDIWNVHSAPLGANNRYIIHVKGADSGDGTLEDPRIYALTLRDEVVSAWDQDNGVGRNVRVELMIRAGGIHKIHVGSGSEYPRVGGTYKILMEWEQPQTLAVGAEVSGYIVDSGVYVVPYEERLNSAGEFVSVTQQQEVVSHSADVYQIVLEQWTNYTISVDGAEVAGMGEGRLRDPVVLKIDYPAPHTGHSLDMSDRGDSGQGNLDMTFWTMGAGTYTITIGADPFNYSVPRAGGYNLRVTKGG